MIRGCNNILLKLVYLWSIILNNSAGQFIKAICIATTSFKAKCICPKGDQNRQVRLYVTPAVLNSYTLSAKSLESLNVLFGMIVVLKLIH